MHNLDTGEHSSPSRKPSGGFHLTSFVEKAIASGALAEEDYSYLALRAIAVITAESYHNPKVANAEAILKNLRCFI
jgi:hypothetical protein